MKEVYKNMNPKDVECNNLNGVYCEIATLLGVESAMILHTAFRGQQVTFPVNFFTSEFIALQIVSEYNGNNIKQLATKYGYSEKWVRKIINNNKK